MARQSGLMFETSRQAGRIPLILVKGESIFVTRMFMNTLLAHHALADSVVIATQHVEQTSLLLQPLRHARVITLPRLESSAQESCLCCGMHSALGDALRKLFFDALRDRSKSLRRVFIESNSMDTEQLTHTLRHTAFLGQRYFLQETVRVREPMTDARSLIEKLNMC